jgi:ElaA protein
MMHFQWLAYGELTTDILYEILSFRQAVFIVEQNCPYQDADGLDQLSFHLVGRCRPNDPLAAYLRVMPPKVKYPEVGIGRLLVVAEKRGRMFGQEIFTEALKQIATLFPGSAVRISAQCYLERFYQSFGFKPISERYEEDGIPHVAMLMRP